MLFDDATLNAPPLVFFVTVNVIVPGYVIFPLVGDNVNVLLILVIVTVLLPVTVLYPALLTL